MPPRFQQFTPSFFKLQLLIFFLPQPTAKCWQSSAIQWQTRCISFSITDSHIQMSTQFSSWNLFPHPGPNYTSWLAVWGHLSGVFLDPRTQREQTQWQASPSERAENNNSSFDRTYMSKVFWNSPFAIRRLPAEANWLSILNIHKQVTDKSGLQRSTLYIRSETGFS